MGLVRSDFAKSFEFMKKISKIFRTILSSLLEHFKINIMLHKNYWKVKESIEHNIEAYLTRYTESPRGGGSQVCIVQIGPRLNTLQILHLGLLQ